MGFKTTELDVYYIDQHINKPLKIYISGSITGNFNYKEEFKIAEKYLTEQGYIVINPIKNEGFDYKDYIDMGLAELSKCDAICILCGAEHSMGAMLELHYAQTVGLYIIEQLEEE